MTTNTCWVTASANRQNNRKPWNIEIPLEQDRADKIFCDFAASELNELKKFTEITDKEKLGYTHAGLFITHPKRSEPRVLPSLGETKVVGHEDHEWCRANNSIYVAELWVTWRVGHSSEPIEIKKMSNHRRTMPIVVRNFSDEIVIRVIDFFEKIEGDIGNTFFSFTIH
jgi:hypothetical protein